MVSTHRSGSGFTRFPKMPANGTFNTTVPRSPWGTWTATASTSWPCLYSTTPALYQNSKLYLDVWKIVNGEVTRPVRGVQISSGGKMAGHSAPAVEASIDDLDGDGFDELVYVHTEAGNVNRLHINVHKWPVTEGVVVLTGMGTKYGYYLTDYDSTWTMHTDYVRFSMNTGMFAYPETEILKKQIGLVSTLPGSSGKEGLRWGIFSWNGTDGLALTAKGTRADGAMAGNVVPTITAADIDGDSMVLGEPTGFTVYDNIEPVFIIQAPPRHWDVLSEGARPGSWTPSRCSTGIRRR